MYSERLRSVSSVSALSPWWLLCVAASICCYISLRVAQLRMIVVRIPPLPTCAIILILPVRAWPSDSSGPTLPFSIEICQLPPLRHHPCLLTSLTDPT